MAIIFKMLTETDFWIVLIKFHNKLSSELSKNSILATIDDKSGVLKKNMKFWHFFAGFS